MYQTSNTYINQYFSEAELNFMIIVLRGNQCELLGFVARMVKATSYTSHNDKDIYTDYDPVTIITKLLAMPHDAIVDLHTRLKRFREFPDAHYHITERLREVGLL